MSAVAPTRLIAPRVPPEIEHLFQISLFLLVVTGFGALASTGKLDLLSLVLVFSALDLALRWGHGRPGQGGGRERDSQPCDGHPHHRRPPVNVGCRLRRRPSGPDFDSRAQDDGLPGPFGNRDRAVMALLLPGAAARGGLEGGADRQAERRLCDRAGRDLPARTPDVAARGRRDPHRRGIARPRVEGPLTLSRRTATAA